MDLAFHNIARPVDFGGVGLARPDNLDSITDWRQRITQFVGEHCQELVFPLVGFQHVALGFFLVRDIRQRSHPLADTAITLENRNGSAEHVAVCAIGG